MTVLAWHTLRAHAIKGFAGELPNAPTEQAIIDAFELEPIAVQVSLDAVIADYANGKARSGWAVWRKRVQAVHVTRDPVATDAAERQKQLKLARAWVDNAGGYIETEAELVHELYGRRADSDEHEDHGRLRHWPDTQTQIVTHWHEARTRAHAAEQKHETYMARLRDASARIRAATQHPDQAEGDRHAERVTNETERAKAAAEFDAYFEGTG